MGKVYDVKNKKLCQHCKYWYSYADICGYSITTNELRTVKMGKRRLPKGKCDKYEPGSSSDRREAFNHGII